LARGGIIEQVGLNNIVDTLEHAVLRAEEARAGAAPAIA
jgi:hypothetical protein